MQKISREEAKAQGLKLYFTEPCKRGHVCGRRVSNENCVECSRLIRHRYNHSDKGLATNRANSARWRKSKKGQTYQKSYRKSEAYRASQKKYRQTDRYKKNWSARYLKNRDLILAQKREARERNKSYRMLNMVWARRYRAAFRLLRKLGVSMEVIDDLARR